jgi:hypothetical protein
MRTIEWLQCSGRPASQRPKSSFLIISQTRRVELFRQIIAQNDQGSAGHYGRGLNLEAIGVGLYSQPGSARSMLLMTFAFVLATIGLLTLVRGLLRLSFFDGRDPCLTGDKLGLALRLQQPAARQPVR